MVKCGVNMKRLILSIVIFLILPSFVYANESITIRTNYKDTKISSASDTMNYGTSTVVTVGQDTNGGLDTTRVLFQTNIINTLLSKYFTIDSARITIYKCSTSTDTIIGSGQIYIYPLDSVFAEGDSAGGIDTTNWTERLHDYEVNDTTGWNTPGGDYDNTTIMDSGAYSASTDSVVFTGDSLDALVKRWIAGTQDNNGIILMTNSEGTPGKYVFASSDSSGREPRIQIWYSIPTVLFEYKILTEDSSGIRQWINDYDLDVGNADTADVALTANGGGSDYADSLTIDNNHVPGDSIPTEKVMFGAISDSTDLALRREHFGDSTAVIDSTYLTDDKIGFEDINNLPETITALDTNTTVEEIKPLISDSIQTVDEITEIDNATDSLATKATHTDIMDSLDIYRTGGEIDTSEIVDADWSQFVKNNQDATTSSGNADSLGHQSYSQIRVQMRDTAQAAMIDSGFARKAGDETITGEWTLGYVLPDSVSVQTPAKPHKVISFGDWQSYPDFTVDDDDTLRAVAQYDSVNALLQPAVRIYMPDTSSELNELDLFSPVIEIPHGYNGIDSIVCDIKTGADTEDSCYAKLFVYEFTDGATTLLDTTDTRSTAGTYTHDANMATLTAIGRYDKFIIRILAKSFCITRDVWIARLYIYWKKGT